MPEGKVRRAKGKVSRPASRSPFRPIGKMGVCNHASASIHFIRLRLNTPQRAVAIAAWRVGDLLRGSFIW